MGEEADACFLHLIFVLFLKFLVQSSEGLYIFLFAFFTYCNPFLCSFELTAYHSQVSTLHPDATSDSTWFLGKSTQALSDENMGMTRGEK